MLDGYSTVRHSSLNERPKAPKDDNRITSGEQIRLTPHLVGRRGAHGIPGNLARAAGARLVHRLPDHLFRLSEPERLERLQPRCDARRLPELPRLVPVADVLALAQRHPRLRGWLDDLQPGG